jgi:hypothetical protein
VIAIAYNGSDALRVALSAHPDVLVPTRHAYSMASR